MGREEVYPPSLLTLKSWLIYLQTFLLTASVYSWALRVSLSAPLPQGMTPAVYPTPWKSSEEDVSSVSSCSNTPYSEAPSDHPDRKSVV